MWVGYGNKESNCSVPSSMDKTDSKRVFVCMAASYQAFNVLIGLGATDLRVHTSNII